MRDQFKNVVICTNHNSLLPKDAKHPWTVGWVTILSCIHIMEHSPPMRTGKLQLLTVTKINHTNTILNEGSQMPTPPQDKAKPTYGIRSQDSSYPVSTLKGILEYFWCPSNGLFLRVTVDHSNFICQNSLHYTFMIFALFCMHVLLQ